MIMDKRRAAAVFRDCYLQPLSIYDAFIMFSPSWITLSQAQCRTLPQTLLQSTIEVKHTALAAVLEKHAAVYCSATEMGAGQK